MTRSQPVASDMEITTTNAPPRSTRALPVTTSATFTGGLRTGEERKSPWQPISLYAPVFRYGPWASKPRYSSRTVLCVIRTYVAGELAPRPPSKPKIRMPQTEPVYVGAPPARSRHPELVGSIFAEESKCDPTARALRMPRQGNERERGRRNILNADRKPLNVHPRVIA